VLPRFKPQYGLANRKGTCCRSEWEKVLFAIREDLGHDNSGLETGDLLRIYVNDIDDLLPAWLANQATNQRSG